MRRTKKKLLVIGIVSVLCMGLVACQPDTNVPETSDPISEEQQEVVESITFPYLIDDGKLEITSLFQYSGMNPDCGNEEGENIASIMVKNISDTYLENAEITLNANDGREFNFLIEELPAGKVVMAFSQENASSEVETTINEVICESTYNTDASMCEDRVSVVVDGTNVTLKNTTDTEIKELVVYCRSTLDEEYFGGITYTYKINNLPADGTAELDAIECILDLADVVRIAINE